MKKFTFLTFALSLLFCSFAIAQNEAIKRTEAKSIDTQTERQSVQIKKQMPEDLNFEKVRIEEVRIENRAEIDGENAVVNKSLENNTESDTELSSKSVIGEDNIMQNQADNSYEEFIFDKDYNFLYQAGNESSGTRSTPSNDNICNAKALPTNGHCLDNESNTNSNSDYSGACVPVGSTSVFYTFTVTAPSNMITIHLGEFSTQNIPLYLMLLKGPCTSPTFVDAYCTNTPNEVAGTLDFSFVNLVPGTVYYVMLATDAGDSNQLSNFSICGLEKANSVPKITGVEQDCFGAVLVCNVSYSQANSYTGVGSVNELNTNFTCLSTREKNSVWYVFSPQANGDFSFLITTTKDYDWALYDLTAIGGCANISSSQPVLCNYSGTYGNTGATSPVNNIGLPRSIGAGGSATMPGITVVANNSYALLVNNYTADATGYTLTFGDAQITDNTAPTMSSAAVSCTSNTVNVTMNELVKCSSITGNGFTLTNNTTGGVFTGAISSFTGLNCTATGLTSTLILNHNGTLTTGVYSLYVNSASTITDKCGNLLQVGGTVTFNYLAPITLTASASNICSGVSVNLNADGADNIATYTLNPGGLTNNTIGQFNGLTPTITTTYTVSATYGGCTRTATATVNVEGNIIVSVDPTNKTVCNISVASPVTLTASTTINGVLCVGCSYLWSNGATTSSISVSSAGTYTVTSATGNTCPSSNTATSTIVLAGGGGGGGSCDVIYVSRLGGGDGYTKVSPTTLSDAVIKARCSNTVIKMMVGVYNLNNFQIVPSYITIEGGYDSNFLTKSSDMSGGANTTIIRRSRIADTGYATDCSAFRVENGAESFRIQNLRIEMPGSPSVPAHTAGTGLTNYGIKLGTGCTDYNIVRCYIDAGVGAIPIP